MVADSLNTSRQLQLANPNIVHRIKLFAKNIVRPISLSLALASTSIVADEVKFSPPEEWIEQAVPSPLPSPLTYLKKVASEDQFIQVTVSALPSVDSSAAANEVTAGQISGMKKGGFVEENVTDIVVSGLSLIHI